MDSDLPNTRPAAVAAGSKFYWTGKPCKHGHIAKRSVRNGICQVCVNEAHKVWLTRNHGKAALYAAAYRTRNLEEVRRKDRETKKAKRAAQPKMERKPSANRHEISVILGKAARIHGERYGYDAVIYRNMHHKVVLLCREHGPFEQTPANHLKGSGCPRCVSTSSRGEQEIASFCRSLGAEVEEKGRKIIAPLELDVFVPAARLAIEHCGLYWHSTLNPRFLAAKTYHIDKRRRCAEIGVRLLTVFGDEWLNRRPQIEAMIARALGQAGKTIGARTCKIERVEAKTFFEANHIQGAAGRSIDYGLIHDGALVAAMSFAEGYSQRGKNGWELVRYATSGQVQGGASRLMSAFVAENAPESIVSYSDNRYFDGAMYQRLGFALDGEVKPDYAVVYPGGGKRVHKAQFARRAIPARIAELGRDDLSFDPETDPRSESQMTELLACGRIYDCGKRRWLWKK